MAVPAVGIASASGAASQAEATFTIGYEGPLSGGNQQLGLNMVCAVQLAINQANATGKLPFKLRLADLRRPGRPHHFAHPGAVGRANKSLVAIVGPAFSGATAAAEPYYGAAHIATVSPSATRVLTGDQRLEQLHPRGRGDDVQGPADADFLVKTKGLKTVYVINDGSFYGAGLAGRRCQATADGATATTATVPGPRSARTAPHRRPSTRVPPRRQLPARPAALFYGGYYCDFGLLLGALQHRRLQGCGHVR